jgi:hypothetical protein
MFGGSALADQFYFQSAGNVTWSGVYVNPYVALDLTTPQNPLLIYCDDWNTDFSGNPTWNANVYALTANNVSNFRYGNTTVNYDFTLHTNQAGDSLTAYSSTTPDAFTRYLEAAWLDNQFQTLGGSAQTQIGIAAAEWTLFVDSNHVAGLVNAINSTGYADAVYNYLQQAQNAVAAGYSAPGWDVMVPVGNSFPMQEFLVDAPVPEPAAIILLATVAALLAFIGMRRKRTAQLASAVSTR